MAYQPEINGRIGVHIPKFIVDILTLVGIIDDSLNSFILYIIGCIRFLILGRTSSHIPEYRTPTPSSEPPFSAVLIREHLPVVKFSDVVCGKEQEVAECAVCLDEFKGDEEIRCLKNCQHFFHSVCLDRWMDQERKTCPVCRKFLVPVELRREFDYLIWADLCAIGCFNDED